jgi:hypothetical protein
VLPPVRSLKRLLVPALVALIPSAPAAAAEGAATTAERAPGFMTVRLARHPTRRAVRARVTTRDGVRGVAMPDALSARLNGRRITREFRTGLGTLTSASLGADTGARFGRNRLVVRAADGHGRVDREAHHFVIRRIRPLAGAGPDRRVKVGRRIRLHGRAKATRRGHRLRFRWRVVGRPGGRRPVLRRTHSRRPVLVAKRRGDYRLRLTVTERGARRPKAVDTVAITAQPAAPPIGVPVGTIPQGVNGIRLAGTLPNTGNWVQVVVLARDSLAVQQNVSFSTSDSPSKLSDLVKGLNTSNLVIVTGGGRKVSLSGSQVSALKTVFSDLGGTTKTLGSGSDLGLGSGQWSLIGVPRMESGQATQSFGIATTPGGAPGGLGGYLQLDNHDNYAFTFGQFEPFDTVAQNTAPNTISVGGQNYAGGSLATGSSGFHVLVLDQQLHEVVNTAIPTNTATGNDSAGEGALQAVLDTIQTRQQPAFVVVQSIGHPGPRDNYWVQQLAPLIGKLGGTVDVFNDLDTNGFGSGGGYTLVGGYQPQGPGLEQSEAMTGTGSAQLSGMLRRNRQSQWVPAAAGPLDGIDLSMAAIAYEPSAPWPYTDTPGHLAATTWIAQQLGLDYTQDIRANYYEKPTAFDAGLLKAESDLVCPRNNPGFNFDDCTDVQGALGHEFGWVNEVNSAFSQFPAMFTTAKIQGLVDIKAISQKVQSSLHNPSSSSGIEVDFLGILSELLVVAQDFAGDENPELSLGLGMAWAAMGVASDVTTSETGSPELSKYEIEASQLGSEMVTSYGDAEHNLAQVRNLLVSNYRALKDAAAKAKTDWSLSTAQTTALQDGLQLSGDQLFYGAFTPLAYHAYALQNDSLMNAAPSSANAYRCIAINNSVPTHPFGDAPASGQYKALTGFDAKGRPQYTNHVLSTRVAMDGGELDIGNSNRVPPSSLTNPMFSPADTGGYALHQPLFFAHNFSPESVHCTDRP